MTKSTGQQAYGLTAYNTELTMLHNKYFYRSHKNMITGIENKQVDYYGTQCWIFFCIR